MMFPLLEIQKTFGKVYDAKFLLQGWELLLASRFTGKQVAEALIQYAQNNSDFPAPANIIEILQPTVKKISEREYHQAIKDYERNGFKQFSYEWQIIQDYRKQEAREYGETKAKHDSLYGGQKQIGGGK